MTMAQLTSMYQAIANGGVMIEPTIGRVDWQEEVATLNGAKKPRSLTTTSTDAAGAATPGHAVWTGTQFFIEIGGKWILTQETAAQIVAAMTDNTGISRRPRPMRRTSEARVAPV